MMGYHLDRGAVPRSSTRKIIGSVFADLFLLPLMIKLQQIDQYF